MVHTPKFSLVFGGIGVFREGSDRHGIPTGNPVSCPLGSGDHSLMLVPSLGCRISGPSLGVDTEMYTVHALRFISPAMPILKLLWEALQRKQWNLRR